MKQFWPLFKILPDFCYSHSQWSLQMYMERRVSAEMEITLYQLVLLPRQAKCVWPLIMHCRLLVHMYLDNLTIFARTGLLDQLASAGMFGSVKRELFLAKLTLLLGRMVTNNYCLAIRNTLSLAEMTHSICRPGDKATKFWQTDGKCL